MPCHDVVEMNRIEKIKTGITVNDVKALLSLYDITERKMNWLLWPRRGALLGSLHGGGGAIANSHPRGSLIYRL